MKQKSINIIHIIISILLTIVISFSSIAMIPIQVYAESSINKHYIIFQYSNGENSNDKIEFKIYSTNKANFDGHLKVKDDSGAVNFDNDVSGTIKYFDDHFQCYCEFKTTWIFGIKYNSNATITVYPFNGKANIAFGGEGWIATMGEYELVGTKNEFYTSELQYNDRLFFCQQG